MRRFAACPACQRPHRADEAACPFCGVAAAKPGRLDELVRTAKVGGLLAFTAVATAACYGSPPMPGGQPLPMASATLAPPGEVVPPKAGSASRFVTPKGGKKAGTTVKLAKAELIDGMLVLTAEKPDTADKFYVKVQAEAKDFEVANGVYKAIDLETVKAFEILWGKDGKGTKGIEPVKGTLQLKDVSATAISGTVLCEVDGTTIALYFNAAR